MFTFNCSVLNFANIKRLMAMYYNTILLAIFTDLLFSRSLHISDFFFNIGPIQFTKSQHFLLFNFATLSNIFTKFARSYEILTVHSIL